MWRMLLPLLAGIGLASLLPGVAPASLLWLLLLTLSTGGILSHFSFSSPEGLSGGVISLFFLVLGWTLALQQERPVERISGERYLATLLEHPYSKNGTFRAEGLLTAVADQEGVRGAHEKIQIYFPREWSGEGLIAGTRILFGVDPMEITNRGNPYEFDYRAYAAAKGFYRQVFLVEDQWQPTGADPRFRMRVAAEKTRDFLLSLYRRSGIGGEEFDILAALTLGYKKSLDTEIRQVFSTTGASHVLAVSGLHTGIVYMIVSFFLGFLRRGRISRYLFMVLALAALWAFAFITGLAPSVQRSALMFSVVLVGDHFRHPSNIWNTLAASAFLLLLINPRLTGDAGFQLSYAAVAGIVFFQPRIAGWLTFRHRVSRYFWELLAVSLASQITTFPLSCFYFHQFPVYFWISNFIVIPAAFLFITLGILVLVTSVVPLVSAFLAQVTALLIHGVYGVLEVTGSLPGALIPGIGFPVSSLVLSYGVLLLVSLFLLRRKIRFLQLAMVVASALFLAGAAGRWRQSTVCEIIVYNRRDPLIHLIAGFRNYLLVSAETPGSGATPPEAAAVISHCHLDKPVILSFSADFSDPWLLKKGPLLSFGGALIALDDGKTPLPGKPPPQMVIHYGNNRLPELWPATTYRISYRRQKGQSPEPNLHSVREMGAWKHSLNLR